MPLKWANIAICMQHMISLSMCVLVMKVPKCLPTLDFIRSERASKTVAAASRLHMPFLRNWKQIEKLNFTKLPFRLIATVVVALKIVICTPHLAAFNKNPLLRQFSLTKSRENSKMNTLISSLLWRCNGVWVIQKAFILNTYLHTHTLVGVCVPSIRPLDIHYSFLPLYALLFYEFVDIH